jgi:sec-independent protein translocase protein TatA
MFDPSAPHIIILMIVVLLLFGSSRLPGAAQALGKSMHIFKKSVTGQNPDDEQMNAATPFSPSATVMPPALPPQQPLAAQDPSAQARIDDLQRQVQELQQQSASGNAGQTSQPI